MIITILLLTHYKKCKTVKIKGSVMYRTIVQLFDERVKESPLAVVQYGKNERGSFIPRTYIQLQEESRAIALALRELGVSRGDRVAIISDNRPEWLSTDLAILSLGAIDVPRGRDSMEYEIEYIIGVSGARIVFSENKAQTEKILAVIDKLPDLALIIAFDEDGCIENDKVKVIKYSDLLSKGKELIAIPNMREIISHEILLGSEEDSATMIFTSGTTGNPKGVVLSHKSLLYQVEKIHPIAPFEKGQIWLSVLPVWHAFERILQYVAIYETHAIAYSKPIGKIMLHDIQVINPHFVGSVPRIWETIKSGVEQALRSKSKVQRKLFFFFLSAARKYKYWQDCLKGLLPKVKKQEGIVKRCIAIFPYLIFKPIAFLGDKLAFSIVKDKLGKNFIGGISGGGSMSSEVSDFFNAMNINLLNGYGLTETGPVVGTSLFVNTIPGFMKKLEGTELKIVDPESRKEVKIGEKGELLIRGPQLMKGYYKDIERTNLTIDKEGFLHSGDLAVMTYNGWFSIIGRIKDTIVLAGGENVEPVPIEQALANSMYIERAVVVGQDKKSLGALIVIDSKSVERYLKDCTIPYISRDGIKDMEEVKSLISREVMKCVSKEKGFKAFEVISRIVLLDKDFEVGRELSAKQEIKRLKINELYKAEIESLW